MTEAVRELLDKAAQSIGAAELLLKEHYFSFAASRACYSMFYAAEVLLLARELTFSRHSAVIAAFGKEIVRTGLLDSRFHGYLLNAFELRNAGDYGGIQAVTEEDARQAVNQSNELLTAIEKYLSRESRPQ